MRFKIHFIDDSTPDSELHHPGKGKGLDLSSRPRGAAYGDLANPFPADLLIPRTDWQAMIADAEKYGARIPDLCDRAGLKVKDQQQTSYCWINSPTHCTEIVRVLENEPLVSLSPASAGAQITHYRNVGGWGKEALEWIVANGLVPSDKWPDNAIDSQYATAGNKALALKYRVQGWWELEPGNMDQIVSCLLRNIPVSAGLSWWGHQVTYTAPRWLDNAIAIEFDNSWGTSYGVNGRGVLQGKRMLPDDAVAPRTAIAA